MRKLGIFILSAAFGICATTYENEKITVKAEEIGKTVYVGGISAGFTLKTGGAQIIGLSEVLTEEGVFSPAAKAGLQVGDIVCKINDIQVETIVDLNEIVNKSNGKALVFQIGRGEESFHVKLQPQKEKNTGKYKVGILIRDTVSGIGTVTYIDKENGRFGSLGHAVSLENNAEMQIYNGIVYECSIVSVNKGMRGKAGELRGMFLNDKPLGSAEKLCCCGIFGQISETFEVDELMSAVASSYDVKPGKAQIHSTINGVSPKAYDIEIVKVDRNNKENKNYVIKITDKDLIEETGGIVQGMSGSPILQNGKLIGAVTHVFLNDPTRGYGIDIERMMKE